MDPLEKNNSELFQVPYLAIDPNDIGRSYKTIIVSTAKVEKAA